MMLWIVGIWIAVGLVLGFALPPVPRLVAPPAMFFHVPMAIAMLVAFMVAAIQGALWLWKRDTKWDRLSLAFAEVGMAFGIIATASGSIWAKANWGHYWHWDLQQIGIVGTLLIYAALFALRGAIEDEEKRRDLWAVYALFGVVAAVFLTYYFRRIYGENGSSHPTDTLSVSTLPYKWTLRFNIVGYIMLLVVVAKLRARMEMARERLKELSWITS